MRNVPFMLTAITKSQTFSQSQSAGAFRGATPALFTSTSARPNRFTVSSPRRCESGRLVTSPTITSASPPALLTWAATVSRFAGRRSASATFAPSCANTTAVAAPMPDPAPVISATLSRSRPAIWRPPWMFLGASPYHGDGAGRDAPAWAIVGRSFSVPGGLDGLSHDPLREARSRCAHHREPARGAQRPEPRDDPRARRGIPRGVGGRRDARHHRGGRRGALLGGPRPRQPGRARGPEGPPGRARPAREPQAAVGAVPRDLPALARGAQADHRPGAGLLHHGRAHAGLVLRPHHRRR